MSVHDLSFSYVSDGSTVYDPATLAGSPLTFRVTNFGDEDLSGLGMFIVAATSVGDVDFPADFPPQTDYQDLISWGQKTALGLAGQGGIKLTLPQNGGTFTGYVTRSQGCLLRNKIPFIDLAAGDSATFTVQFETPPATAARRFYVDLKLE